VTGSICCGLCRKAIKKKTAAYSLAFTVVKMMQKLLSSVSEKNLDLPIFRKDSRFTRGIWERIAGQRGLFLRTEATPAPYSFPRRMLPGAGGAPLAFLT